MSETIRARKQVEAIIRHVNDLNKQKRELELNLSSMLVEYDSMSENVSEYDQEILRLSEIATLLQSDVSSKSEQLKSMNKDSIQLSAIFATIETDKIASTEWSERQKNMLQQEITEMEQKVQSLEQNVENHFAELRQRIGPAMEKWEKLQQEWEKLERKEEKTKGDVAVAVDDGENRDPSQIEENERKIIVSDSLLPDRLCSPPLTTEVGIHPPQTSQPRVENKTKVGEIDKVQDLHNYTTATAEILVPCLEQVQEFESAIDTVIRTQRCLKSLNMN